MKVEFNKATIAFIASKLREHKKLFVSTEGQMFTVEHDAREAIITKNGILTDPNEYVGLVAMTEDMVSVEKVKAIMKDPEVFNEYFKDAKVPVAKTAEKKDFERKFEQRSDKAIDDDLKALMGEETDDDEDESFVDADPNKDAEPFVPEQKKDAEPFVPSETKKEETKPFVPSETKKEETKPFAPQTKK